MPLEWMYAFSSAAILALLFGLIIWRITAAKQTALSNAESKRLELSSLLTSSEDRLKVLSEQLQRQERATEALNSQRVKVASLEAKLEAQGIAAQKLQAELLTQTNKADEATQKIVQLSSRLAELNTSQEEREKAHNDQLRLLQGSRDDLKKEFELLALEVLERKSKSFKEQSEASLKQMLNPLHSDVKGFREKVETLHNEETKQRASLTQELKNLQSLNQQITDRAEELTNALQGQKKVQGNWGELMLENVLDSAGLRIGEDYEREKSFTTEDGKFRPDAIVYLPQKKHLVIDAKTSLNAYTEYVNADSEEVRDSALKAHALAVGERIKELSDKSYFSLPGLNSPEVVVMFIPIESAYVEALKYDNTLYQRAIEQNVLVATPTTLLTSLNIVRQLWRFEDQNKHSAELANRASKFYDKLRLFLESMSKVGRQMDSARSSYDKAMEQLYTGRANVIKQASEFQKLGVSVQRELDRDIVEKAELELPASTGAIESSDRD